MATKADLIDWIQEGLIALGGKSEIVPLCQEIWSKHGTEIQRSGELFYTWQYDMRWAATTLRRQGKIVDADNSPRGVWELLR